MRNPEDTKLPAGPLKTGDNGSLVKSNSTASPFHGNWDVSSQLRQSRFHKRYSLVGVALAKAERNAKTVFTTEHFTGIRAIKKSQTFSGTIRKGPDYMEHPGTHFPSNGVDPHEGSISTVSHSGDILKTQRAAD